MLFVWVLEKDFVSLQRDLKCRSRECLKAFVNNEQ